MLVLMFSPRGSPEEARPVEVEHTGPIHLLISDTIMLHTSGPDLADELIARRSEMRVMLISGCPDDIRVLRYDGPFLKKLFRRNESLGMVNDALCGKAYERANGAAQ
jgi:FixJ family two-component response regulator